MRAHRDSFSNRFVNVGVKNMDIWKLSLWYLALLNIETGNNNLVLISSVRHFHKVVSNLF